MNLLSEKPGSSSTMRLLSILTTSVALIIAIVVCILAWKKGDGDIGGNTLALILGLVGLGFTGKAVQKGMESKSEDKPE
jgi:hypothetical protein